MQRSSRLHIIGKVSDKTTTPAAAGWAGHKMCYVKIPLRHRQHTTPKQPKAPNQITRELSLLGERPPLDRQDDAVLAPDSDGGRALPDGLHGVLDLEEVAVGAEDGDSAIVAHLGDCNLVAAGGRTNMVRVVWEGGVAVHATAATKNEPMVLHLPLRHSSSKTPGQTDHGRPTPATDHRPSSRWLTG